MVWRAAKGILEDSRSDLAEQHWDRGGGGWPGVADPKEWCARRECGVRGERNRLHLRKLVQHLRWGGEKTPRFLVPWDREIGGECRVAGCLLRSAEDGLKGYARLFYKHAKKCFAIFQAAEIAGVADEEAGCLLESFESVLR